jgi:hypothetical protein
MKLSREGIIQVGSALLGSGVTLAGGYWIYIKQAADHESFWSPLGYLSCLLTVAGVIVCIWGLFGPAPPETPLMAQEQSSGERSTNYQAGRDIRITEDGDINDD